MLLRVRFSDGTVVDYKDILRFRIYDMGFAVKVSGDLDGPFGSDAIGVNIFSGDDVQVEILG